MSEKDRIKKEHILYDRDTFLKEEAEEQYTKDIEKDEQYKKDLKVFEKWMKTTYLSKENKEYAKNIRECDPESAFWLFRNGLECGRNE